MSMTLPLTNHNLDYFLEAYAREWQPSMVRVPYDRWGNEIVLPAPRREDVQRVVLEFDFKKFFGSDRIQVNFLGDSFFSKKVQIIDPRHYELTAEKIAEGLYVYHHGTAYLYATRKDSADGLERLTHAVRQFYRSKDGRCEVEHLDVSLSIIRTNYGKDDLTLSD